MKNRFYFALLLVFLTPGSMASENKKVPIIDGKWVALSGDCNDDHIDSSINVSGNEINIWEGACTISKASNIDAGVYNVELWCESEGEQSIFMNKFVVHNAHSFTWKSKFNSGVNVKFVHCN